MFGLFFCFFLFFSLFVRIGAPRIRSCFSFSSKFLLWGVVSRSDVIGVISLQLRSFLEVLLVVQTEPSRRWPVYSV